MYRQTTAAIVSMVSLVAGCTPRSSSPPTPGPVLPSTPGAEQVGIRAQLFIPNTYRYHFRQTAEIRADGPADTVPSSITTRGVFVVHVTSEPDSGVAVAVSVDSISITSHGSIPSRGLQQPLRLDSVISARFTRSGVLSTTQLPDSLCAYGQFVAAARELLLPELGLQVHSPTHQVFRDSLRQQVCRAGITIEVVTVRELRDLNQNPTELTLNQRTEMHGGGVLRRDSISVAGSIITRGIVSFQSPNRLPSSIRTHSDGAVTVQLGNTKTVFRQISTQETRLEGISPP